MPCAQHVTDSLPYGQDNEGERSMHEFKAWPKTARLFRDVVVTEKLDGTNAAVHISEAASFEIPPAACAVNVDGTVYHVSAQSRKRMITPGKTTDNYGFAGWVHDNAAALVRLLGEGTHYGEWWGAGIQRNYGRTGRSFSLFNTERFAELDESVGTHGDAKVWLDSVPVLYKGPFSEHRIAHALTSLREYGSIAAPGFMDPEGICVYHTASRTTYKVTLDNNDAGKWETAG